MELYGLVSIIDQHRFRDARRFGTQSSRLVDGRRFDDLKARLEPVCHRTLRRQVVEYVSYTNRVPATRSSCRRSPGGANAPRCTRLTHRLTYVSARVSGRGCLSFYLRSQV